MAVQAAEIAGGDGYFRIACSSLYPHLVSQAEPTQGDAQRNNYTENPRTRRRVETLISGTTLSSPTHSERTRSPVSKKPTSCVTDLWDHVVGEPHANNPSGIDICRDVNGFLD